MSDYSPLQELDNLMRRGEYIRRSTSVKSTSDDWMSKPPVDWVAPDQHCETCSCSAKRQSGDGNG